MPPSDLSVEESALKQIVRDVLLAAGLPTRAADLITDHLVLANLMGHDSHGVGMIPAYISNILTGDLRVDAALNAILDDGSLLIYEAGQGPGQVMAHDAIEAGIERARRQGLCLMGLRNSHHIGRIGHYAEQCTAAGMVSLHFVNVVSTPAGAPFGGNKPRLGTNPLAIGIPRGNAEPIIVDFATSRWAVGKVRVAHNEGRPVPPGTLLDPDGQPTTDAGALFANPPGALLPFGEHKGWCLSLACELLGAALIGGPVQAGPKASPAILNSMLTVIVSPERLRTDEAFQSGIEAVVQWATGAAAEVQLPGQPERSTLTKRRKHGIPIDGATWAQIQEAARSVGSSAADAIAHLSPE